MKDILAELMGEWCTGVNIGGMILKICLAIVLSAVIGSERATKRHAAGLRTFMLVSLVSALAATVDKFLITEYGVSIPVVTGATVIGLAIVSSNTILYSSKSQIKGLTTSVALWGNSILSVLIGLDLYLIALVAFAAFMLCLTGFMQFEYALKRRSDYFEIHLELNNKNSLQEFIAVIRKLGLKVDDIELNTAYMNTGLFVYSVSLSIDKKKVGQKVKHDDIISAISELEYVNYVEELGC